MLIIVPTAHVFADENDGIMVIGQPISTTSSKPAYGSYSNGCSYGVNFVISVSFERTSTSVKNFTINSYSAGAFAVEDPADYFAQVESCYIESKTITGNKVKVVMVAKVGVNNNGSYKTETLKVTFDF